MKKFTTYLAVVATLVYYSASPLVVALADSGPLSSTSSGASTPAFTANNDFPLSTLTTLYMRVTAYASVPDETDDTPFITANGTHVYYGEAASNILPFGTKIEIPALFGDQVFTIEDRMSTKIKNTIDVWMPTVTAAIRFGMSHTDIVILSKPTSSETLADAK